MVCTQSINGDREANPVLVGGVDVKLTEEEIKYLEEPYKPQNVLGH